MTTEQELEALRAQYAPTEEETGAAPSLTEMNDLAEHIAELRDKKKDLEEHLSETSAKLEALQKRVIDVLMENGLTSYKAPAGTMSVTHHFSAKLPQGEEKAKCYEYLKSIGRFEDMASIHSATFNSWVKEQYELAKERGEDEPKLPGVTDVSTLLRISFRRSK